MGSLSNQQSQQDDHTSMEQVAVIMVPFAAQGHLNQLMQLSCLISSYGLPVFYVSSAIHTHQARVRVNGLNPLDLAKIHFHNIPAPPFASPPPDPNSSSKFPEQLQPAWEASLSLRQPFAEYLREMSEKFKRVVVVHDPMTAAVVQDVISIHNAESCIQLHSRIFSGVFHWGRPTRLLSRAPERVGFFARMYTRKVSLSDEQIKELALGLEQSKVKFLWVLRDADKGDIFDGQVRRAELPEGFEERVKEVGMVVRDWAPQPEILAHTSTGGFMSHCGWNSCIESITMGVPIAAWPMHSDQPRNTMFITQVLKMGIVVMEWEQRMELVKASAIENAVRRLMASEEGDEIRKTAAELAATLRQATEPGGASRLELDSFVAHITR
ncbi:UNVERIFIED_CONTAM: Zeatin O-xylosyltransferase [Sesamum calycinum]|uniref:Zeatin O-xylosyltransferase n=1 Tax=Sesamum calycinum TaxID=2727403 RepID=A0AAW2N4R3_9LAMI